MITNWNALPLVMHVEHIAALTGLKRSAIWKRCQQRRKTAGGPVDWHARPYEWYRESVRDYYERGGQPKPRGPRRASVDVRDGKAQLLRAVNA